MTSIVHRLQRLEHLAGKFNRKATNVENWLQTKDAMLERNDDIDGANLAEVMVRSGLWFLNNAPSLGFFLLLKSW